MKEYLKALGHVLGTGVDREDRTGVGTRSVFGYQMRFDLTRSFPAVTTKHLVFSGVKAELLWFLEGSSDERRLAEIQYGTRDPARTTIWTQNANADYWKPHAKFEGDVGRIYGTQMRAWTRPDGTTLDQIQRVIDLIQTDPYSRRLLVINYNPGEVEQQSLPACHTLFQFYVNDKSLSCQVYIRSNDLPLGTPFNIASYALLTSMIGHVTGLVPHELILTVGDLHIYHNQMPGVREQISRKPLPLPKLVLNPDVRNINDFKMDDIQLVGYESHPTIKYPFAV